jgi:hypothetical protein
MHLEPRETESAQLVNPPPPSELHHHLSRWTDPDNDKCS